MPIRLASILILAATVLLAPMARADEKTDAVELVRLAQVAERVERDVRKALELYRKALEVGGTTPAALEAALRIAAIQEERRETSLALESLRHVRDRFGEQLDERQKRQVHDALARLLPPGSRERSPLGEIYVVPSERVAERASPLDRKIREMIARLDDATPQDRWNVEQALRRELETVGREALPVLEDVMRNDRPERAKFAARSYAYFGQVEAIGGLERALRQGDGLTRGAVLEALGELRRSEEVSTVLVPVLDGALRDESLAAHHDRLRSYLAGHLDAASLMARHAAGGEHAGYWLRQALGRKAEGALERALELAQQGGAAGSQALVALIPYVAPSGNTKPLYPPETLGADRAAEFLDLLLTQPDERQAFNESLVRLLDMVRRARGEEATQDATKRVWARLAGTPDASRARELAEALTSRGIAPPLSLFEDAAWSKAYWLHAPYVTRTTSGSHAFLALLDHDRVWRSFFAAVHTQSAKEVRGLLGLLQRRYPANPSVPDLPPPAYDLEWVRLLASEVPEWQYPPPPFVVKAVVRSADPKVLELLRERLTSADHHIYSQLLSALVDYEGPGLMAFLEEAMGNPRVPQAVRTNLLRLFTTDKVEGHPRLVAMAGDWNHPIARYALGLLDDIGAAQGALAIAKRVQPSLQEVPTGYRTTLIGMLSKLHLREAVPYLLAEYKAGTLAKTAAGAMDDIRNYHRRLEMFEAFAKRGADTVGGEDETDLMALLSDSDAEIRRAAVVALGALGRKEALPTLVKMGKQDADAGVRQAALEAVERISKSR